MNDATIATESLQDPLVDRAIRLFTFLGQAQRLRTSRVCDLDSYRRDGAVLWLADAPVHPAISNRLRVPPTEGDTMVLTIDRIAPVPPPEPTGDLTGWVDEPDGNPRHEPTLRDHRFLELAERDGDLVRRRVELHERPDISAAHERYLLEWRAWAEQELRDQPVRDYYGSLFSAYVSSTSHPEELELVIGTSLLAWAPPGHERVRRHLLTVAARLVFDENSGRLTVLIDDTVDGATVELEMLDPGLVGQPRLVNELRERARDSDAHPLDRDRMGELGRRIVNQLSADAHYRDDDDATQPGPAPIASFAPAVLLRKRSQQGLVEIFRRIVDQLREAGTVPDGVRPLVDADHAPAGSAGAESGSGALVRVDDDPFLPLPVNERQLQILQRVDTTAQTLIQGPPGTGKTHTAAALITHLLAQGKRILVTAQTDRALKEVREKLPEAVRPLAVAVVGSSREDMSDLRVAVERIASTAAEHDADEAATTIERHLGAIDELRRLRAELTQQLREAREREVDEVEIAGYRGSLAEIARQVRGDDATSGWLTELESAPAGHSPASSDEVAEWRRLLRDVDLSADEHEAGRRLVKLDAVPDPARFAELVRAERDAHAFAESFGPLRGHPAHGPASALGPEEREAVARRIGALAEDVRSLQNRPEPWVREALGDLAQSRGSVWSGRYAEITALTEQVRQAVTALGPATEVRVQGDDIGLLVPVARSVADHLAADNTIKLGSDGLPKIGMLTSRVVRSAESFFARVRVDGQAPTTSRQVGAFLTWVETERMLDALDRAWPASVRIPEEDTPAERLEWHRAESVLLGRLLDVDARLHAETGRLVGLAMPVPQWFTAPEPPLYIKTLHGVHAAEQAEATTERLDRATEAVVHTDREADAAPVVSTLGEAVRRRDDRAYAAAYRRMERLHTARGLLCRRDELQATLSAAPGLAAAIASTADAPIWDDRIPLLETAWRHAVASAWLAAQEAVDVNAVQQEILAVEGRIRGHVEELSAIRAWGHAVAPGRLTRGSRASLEQYASLVKRLGKGTGVYATQRRSEIRAAMDRCRPAVPVWIMPLYRIADQFDVRPDMFDVVIVDEASQAGIEASFLQYLAPKIVVIGDDRQVSPSAVGVDQQELRDLGAQYLYDDRFRSTWQDPQRSLFDEAKMRFSGMITLVEHRRCVPEIINFSNKIAYEPDGIRLIPVRQFGADRLEPIKPVLVRDGYERGTSSKTNPAEIDAIVAQIEKCLADPDYDGRTFGVISLLGPTQAKAIEKALLDRVSPEEWSARDLRCGDAADFQGSERDVVFLSMVAAPGPDRRLSALTAMQYVQRYNVAVSRARDQLWVFHSMDQSTLTNPEDMRYQLLDYCYGVARRSAVTDERQSTSLVPEDLRVAPFGSLFEQRVHNRILDHGYTLIPQYESLGYSIDLVAVGPTARLAIECDGDFWHGPEAHQRDMGRQRELERCGWRFHRILESEFYRDPAGALEPLWARLAELDIRPAGWATVSAAEAQVDIHANDATTLDEVATPDLGIPAIPAPFVEDTVAVRPAAGAPAAVLPTVSAPASEDPAVTAEASRAASPQRAVYQQFRGTTTPVSDASPREIVDGLVEIVAAEGPIMGARLHTVYVRAASGVRAGSQITKALNSAISGAIRQGRLVRDNPLGEVGIRPATLRLPDQATVRVRALGPRSFDQVPPAELAAVMAEEAEIIGWADPSAVYRATMLRYDITKLGSVVRARLEAVSRLVRCSEGDGHDGP
jgi:very-short-patch-repair endonuclease